MKAERKGKTADESGGESMIKVGRGSKTAYESEGKEKPQKKKKISLRRNILHRRTTFI